ncbi:hypothetical protein [Bosea sp. PAMC 26642]|uniref:hypothetical protein n=1 Tax=Bosea sp. (strain PAMC 26642) TaxID=1792307 RepID=UPI0007700CEE|nr:hypothetical protein [Bosea sp. PAMC 26642]AMJ60863.1 hypothetical protein AXW83_11655 [Bosea sp. PAMC 26642]
MTEAVDDVDAKRIILVRNERLKLAATYLNGIAIATLAVGGIGPFVAGFVANAPGHFSLSSGLVVVCTITSATLHLAAWRVLGGLRV